MLEPSTEFPNYPDGETRDGISRDCDRREQQRHRRIEHRYDFDNYSARRRIDLRDSNNRTVRVA